jgi:peroxiredoxin
VCDDQLGLYNELMPAFDRFNAALLAISVDGVWSHSTYARQRKIHFPLLSDFEPKGAVARAYGVYRFWEGVSERALFVLDGRARIHWSQVSPIGLNPGADGILAALDALSPRRVAI